MAGEDFAGLAGELEALFATGPYPAWPAHRFDELALRCFEVQFRDNPMYRSLCTSRNVTPETLRRWQDTPAVPATAFKHMDLLTGPPDSVEAVFRTSGTTGGGGVRGRHLVRSRALYRASALGNFEAHLLLEGAGLPLVSLIPSPAEAPDSSLSAMMGMVAENLAASVRWVVGGDGALDLTAFRDAVEGERPLLVAGTAFAFAHLLDALAGDEVPALPEGSRIMETGGFKGRVRDMSRDELYAGLAGTLGVPLDRIVNEYGMTELLSQLYEPVLAEGLPTGRRHVPPPWLRVRALDPVTLEELPSGEEGILAFFDLANLGSVCHVLTEDVGAVDESGVRLRGRAPGAEPRGCSRAMDDLMRAVRGGA